MCRDCAHWRGDLSFWGDCLCPEYQFKWVPYTQLPPERKERGLTLQQLNDSIRVDPVPFTSGGYGCPHWADRKDTLA